MSNKKDDATGEDWSGFYRTRLEKRLVDHLEAACGLWSEDVRGNLQAQHALTARYIENIALMLAEGGYTDNHGRFVRFSPTDLISVGSALKMGLALRADIMMLPLGLEAMGKAMKSMDSSAPKNNVGSNPGVGLSQPPPLTPVDQQPQPESMQTGQTVKDQEATMVPIALPAKTQS